MGNTRPELYEEKKTTRRQVVNRRLFIGLYSFIILAIIFTVAALFTGSPEIKWIIPAIGLALISIGLGLTSFFIALNADSTVSMINSKLEEIKQIQQDMHAELQQQKSSSSPIVATLQGLSQHYLDYLTKQKQENEGGKT